MTKNKVEFIFYDIDSNMNTKAWASVIMEITYDDTETAHVLCKKLMDMLHADEYRIK